MIGSSTIHVLAATGLMLLSGGVLGGCARRGNVDPAIASVLHDACPPDRYWSEGECRPRVGLDSLAQAVAALEAFQVDEALTLLDETEKRGPFARHHYVQLFEQRGIAHAYLDNEPAASAAFSELVRLSPGHLLSYTLSPKATFLFERARRAADPGRTPALDVDWARDASVDKSFPLSLEVIVDPERQLRRAAIHVRKKGEDAYRVLDVPLLPSKELRRVALPAFGGETAQVLELFVRAYDIRGNEVLTWATPERPREVLLRYDRPVPWFKKWWVWAAVGGSLAVTTGVTVYALGWEPSDLIGGSFTATKQ